MQQTRRIRITGGRVLDPSQGLDSYGDLVLDGGLVVGFATEAGAADGEMVLDATGMVVCPGFVDLHCHLRDPGFEHKETIATGGTAAAAGGFTTICCMPDTRPALDSAASIEYVRDQAARSSPVRVLPVGAVTKGLAGTEMAEMEEMATAGAVAFSDDGHPIASSRTLRHALEYALITGRPLVDHCEDPDLAAGGVMHEGWVANCLGLKGVPAEAEVIAVERDLRLLELTGGRLHLAHLTTSKSVEAVRRAKERGLPVTAEVTPHHLTMTAEWVMGHRWDRRLERAVASPAYDTRCKVDPPLRTEVDIETLIGALRDGTVDAIATDHSPHAQVDKEVEFAMAAPGISGLETALGVVMRLVHQGRLSLSEVIGALTYRPARAFALPYGTLRPGSPADVIVFHPDLKWPVHAGRFKSRGKNTPLDGVELQGKVMFTIVGGQIVFQEDNAGG